MGLSYEVRAESYDMLREAWYAEGWLAWFQVPVRGFYCPFPCFNRRFEDITFTR